MAVGLSGGSECEGEGSRERWEGRKVREQDGLGSGAWKETWGLPPPAAAPLRWPHSGPSVCPLHLHHFLVSFIISPVSPSTMSSPLHGSSLSPFATLLQQGLTFPSFSLSAIHKSALMAVA